MPAPRSIEDFDITEKDFLILYEALQVVPMEKLKEISFEVPTLGGGKGITITHMNTVNDISSLLKRMDDFAMEHF